MAKAAKKEVQQQEETKEVGLGRAAQDKTMALTESQSGAWGSENVASSDLIIPKILATQGLSKLVSEGKATVGEIRDSLNGEKLGDKSTPVDIIAFSSFRTWVIFEKRNGKDEYVKTERITPENEGWAINEVVNGVEVRRDKCLNFYVLLPSEIESGMAFPYLVSLRRYGMQAGKKLSTFAAKLKAFNKPIAAKVFKLGVVKQENDKGVFFVFDVTAGRDSSAAELAEAHKWYKTVQTATVKHDDSDLKAEAAQAPSYQDESQDF